MVQNSNKNRNVINEVKLKKRSINLKSEKLILIMFKIIVMVRPFYEKDQQIKKYQKSFFNNV